MKNNPTKAAQMAFDLDAHRKKVSSPRQAVLSPKDDDEEADKDLPRLVFNDNIELEDFVKVPADRQYKYRVNLNQFTEKVTPKIPYVFTSNEKLRRLPPSVVKRDGFWMKLCLTGSG